MIYTCNEQAFVFLCGGVKLVSDVSVRTRPLMTDGGDDLAE